MSSAVESSLGVIECFFGPMWSDEDRIDWARFLGEEGFGFHIYAPKADAFLRRKWTESWTPEYADRLARMAAGFHAHGVRYGVGLSPWGIQEMSREASVEAAKRKLDVLKSAGTDFVGIFFDDMKVYEGLAETQIALIRSLEQASPLPLLFCPSFYSYDPILDKVFGERPASYLDQIGEGIPKSVDILWTGPKVISEEISLEHLDEVSEVLRRKAFICDNLFANDGPKNCKFLKFKEPKGRSPRSLERTARWAFNPMNQPRLSKPLLLAARDCLIEGFDSGGALSRSFKHCFNELLAAFLEEKRALFLEKGLDSISEQRRLELLAELREISDAAASEVAAWLEGRYSVGSECLTD